MSYLALKAHTTVNTSDIIINTVNPLGIRKPANQASIPSKHKTFVEHFMFAGYDTFTACYFDGGP